jgi:hypothetical protein
LGSLAFCMTSASRAVASRRRWAGFHFGGEGLSLDQRVDGLGLGLLTR